MDIHKPKPWRGLREFLKEYLIIVVGVLTALGAEAVVQNLHDKRLSAEAREAVRDEIGLNLVSINHRNEQQRCINARVKEITDLLDKAERGQPFAPAHLIAPVGARLAYTQRWQAATAGGRTSLLSTEEQRDLARVYMQFGFINERKALEEQAWTRLMALEDRERLSPEEIARAREALSEARGQGYWMRVNILQANTYALMLGIKPKGDAQGPETALLRRTRVLPFCLPITTSREAAQRIVQDKIGMDY